MGTKSANKKTYTQKLLKAAIAGICSGEALALSESPAALILKCVPGALAGKCVDALVFKRRDRTSRTVACVTLGGLAALVWSTRTTTRAMARSAAQEIGKIRDEHWLDRNPINYA
jgi:hypothetical protein